MYMPPTVSAATAVCLGRTRQPASETASEAVAAKRHCNSHARIGEPSLALTDMSLFPTIYMRHSERIVVRAVGMHLAVLH